MRNSQKSFLKLSLILSAALLGAARIWASTYYLSPTGSDTGTGSSLSPWKTSTKAFTVARGGDTVIWKDGTYTYAGGNISNPPSGTAGNYLVLKAESDGGAIFKNYEEAITIDQRAYVQIEGFTIKDGLGSHAINITDSNHIKVFRVGVKNGAAWNQRHANVVQLSSLDGVTGTKDCLLEDVWVVGVMRYGILIGGSRGYSERNILRRCVVRFDGSGSVEPHAGITNYGATTGVDGARNNLVQNCITLDFNAPDNSSGEGVYAGFYNPHSAVNIDFYGCIALKTREGGWLLNEDGDSSSNDMYNCVVWQPLGYGITGQRGTTPGSTIEQVTVGAAGNSGYASFNGAQATIRNSLFYNNGGANSGATSENYNLFYNVSASGLNALTSNPLLKYITRIETNSPAYQSGQGSATRGATIVKRYGVSGTLHGETGYDQLTSEDLWPFPYQQRIHNLFAEPDGSLSMPSNDTQRGFAAPSTTLTKYIWEFLGNADPNASDTSDTTRPSVISAAALNETTVTVLFSEALDLTTAQTPANYSISNSISVNSATVTGDNRTVSLTVSPLVKGLSYIVTVNNVADQASPANAVLPGSAASFAFGSSSSGGGSTAASGPPDPLKPQQKIMTPGEPLQFGSDAVSVAIHDSQGNVIYSGSKSGSSVLAWDGKDSNGKSVKSGVYMSKIAGPNGSVAYAPIIIVK